MLRVTKNKRTINLFLGLISTISFLPIMFVSGVSALFSDCPSCDARIPLSILILALLGAICSIVLTILKDTPYRIDTLFLLPAFILGIFAFSEITSSAAHDIQIIEKYIPLALYSAGIALLIEMGFIIWMCVKFLNNKSEKIHIKETTTVHPSQNFPVSPNITPLLGAIITGDLALVQTALTDHPEELNTAYAQNGNTPLHVAALNGYTDIVRLLLAQPGIDTTRTNNEGKTALDLANLKGHVEIAQLLEQYH